MNSITRRKRKPHIHSKFNRSSQRIIYEALRSKLPLTRAIELAGIKYGSFRQWMIAGRNPKNFFHHRFRKKVKSIIAEREKEAIEVIRSGAKGGIPIVEKRITRGPKGREISILKKKTQPSWQAASRYLEVIARETYGQGTGKNYPVHEEDETPLKSNVELNVSGSIETEQNLLMTEALRKLGEDEIEQLANILRKVKERSATTVVDTSIQEED